MEPDYSTATDPTLFRVSALEPFPVPGISQPGWRMLRVEFLNHPEGLRKVAYDMSPEWYGPYQEAAEEAIQSQKVYWVEDLDYSRTPSFPLRMNDTVPQRLLKAIGNKQIVRGQE